MKIRLLIESFAFAFIRNRQMKNLKNNNKTVFRREFENSNFSAVDELDANGNRVYTELANNDIPFMCCRFEYDSKNREVYREWGDGSYVETTYNVFGKRKSKDFSSGGKYFGYENL